MPIISNQMRKAIHHCLRHQLSFAVFRCPGGSVRFIASQQDFMSLEQRVFFSITPWQGDVEDSLCIGYEYDEYTVMKAESGFPRVAAKNLPATTKHSDYIRSVSELIERLKQRGGKTVISRTFTDNAPGIDWVDVAEELFAAFPNCLCHLFYHVQCGGWIGATPELLLEYDEYADSYATMSLAGTLPVDQPWDEKNCHEQQMVTDFIVDKLHHIATDIKVGEEKDVVYGNIKHRCNIICFDSDKGIAVVANTLNPTPAVCGLPREEALADINAIEKHKRQCYGGLVSPQIGTVGWFYVNLRCLQFSGDKYTIYTGGGITAESDPETEWQETIAKAQPLLNIINSCKKNG